MRKVIAAVTNDTVVQSVLAAARAFGELLDAEVEALHVRVGGTRTVDAAASAAGVPLRLAPPPVVATLVEEAAAGEVVALVAGARSTEVGARPAGHIALQVAVRLDKPLLVVPPEIDVPARLRRILLPLNGTRESGAAFSEILDLATRRAISLVVLHVHDVASIPLFTEQPQHELDAWADEFLHRHLVEHEHVQLELRAGAAPPSVLEVAVEVGADLIALGWSQELAHGHAAVVREALERSPVPVLLVPVSRAGRRRAPHAALAGGAVR